MKIEWLDKAYTGALVTKGWFTKRQAVVVFRDKYWHYETGGQMISDGSWFACGLYGEQREKRHEEPWQPVAKLPKATVVKSGK